MATLVVLSAGGAALRLWVVARSTHPSPFECLAKANTGWLTVSANGTTVHADWKDEAGHIDGVLSGGGAVTDDAARKLAVELTAPLGAAGKTAHSSANVSIFALCDGVPRWWTGASIGSPTLRSCLSFHPRTMVQCARDVVLTPAPVSSSEAWEVAKKVHAVGGGVMPSDEEMPVHFTIPHWRGPPDGVE